MTDDGLEALDSAATSPEAESLNRALDAWAYLESPEGEMFSKASERLASASLCVRDAHDALSGMTEARWRYLSLRPGSAAHLRSLMGEVAFQMRAVAHLIEHMESRS